MIVAGNLGPDREVGFWPARIAAGCLLFFIGVCLFLLKDLTIAIYTSPLCVVL